jgi:hypothetical protein
LTGCATATLHKKRGLDSPEITSQFTTRHSKVIKTSSGKYYIDSRNIKENFSQNECLLIASEGETFYKKLNSVLYLENQIKINSINLIIDESEDKSIISSSTRIKVSFGFTVNLKDHEEPLIISKYGINKIFPTYGKFKNNCFSTSYKYDLLESIIMDQLKKKQEFYSTDSYMMIEGLLDKNNKIIDDKCSSIKEKIEKKEISHIGVLFSVYQREKVGFGKTKIHKNYVAIPFNFLEYYNFDNGLKIDYKEQEPTDSPFNPLMNREKRILDHQKMIDSQFSQAEKYFLKLSSRTHAKEYFLKHYDIYDTEEVIQTFDMPTTLTKVTSKKKYKKYHIALRVAGTPAALALDILTSPFQLSYLLLILTFGPG